MCIDFITAVDFMKVYKAIDQCMILKQKFSIILFLFGSNNLRFMSIQSILVAIVCHLELETFNLSYLPYLQKWHKRAQGLFKPQG